MFKYDPKDAEGNDFKILPAGIYEAEIIEVEDKVSKAGNEMLVITLNAFGGDGEKVRLYDYVVNPNGLWKLKSICRCLGLEFDGAMDEQLLVGKRFKVKLKVKPEGDFPAKNEVEHYEEGVGVASTPALTITNSTDSSKPKDDDIPF